MTKKMLSYAEQLWDGIESSDQRTAGPREKSVGDQRRHPAYSAKRERAK
jgi:hypothetical protein